MAQSHNSIIAFAGRMRCGKSTLASVTEKYGYERVSFATPLKNLVAHIMHVKLEDIASLKTANGNFEISDEDCRFISEETGIDAQEVSKTLQEHPWQNSRQLLQVVGTDLIRHFNADWHANKLKEYILSSENDKFVFDDLRFKNERQMIEELGGDCWFVVRPYLDEISNHVSETSLNWHEFLNVIVTNGDANYLSYNWDTFMKMGYEMSMKKRNTLIEKIFSEPEVKRGIAENTALFTLQDALFVSRHEYTYKGLFRYIEPFKVQKCHDYAIVQMEEGECEQTVSNPLELEDLKFYL